MLPFFRLKPYKTAKKGNSEVQTSSLPFLGGSYAYNDYDK